MDSYRVQEARWSGITPPHGKQNLQWLEQAASLGFCGMDNSVMIQAHEQELRNEFNGVICGCKPEKNGVGSIR